MLSLWFGIFAQNKHEWGIEKCVKQSGCMNHTSCRMPAYVALANYTSIRKGVLSHPASVNDLHTMQVVSYTLQLEPDACLQPTDPTSTYGGWLIERQVARGSIVHLLQYVRTWIMNTCLHMHRSPVISLRTKHVPCTHTCLSTCGDIDLTPLDPW